jgi:hypothetical protein
MDSLFLRDDTGRIYIDRIQLDKEEIPAITHDEHLDRLTAQSSYALY